MPKTILRPHLALLLPEILGMILWHVHKPNSADTWLTSARKVCQLWVQESMRIYWASPPMSTLSNAPAHRRPALAERIEALAVSPGTGNYASLLRFPRLQLLRVRSGCVSDAALNLAPCFQPRLVVLECPVALLCQPATAGRVLANCPRLSTLRIAFLEHWPTEDEANYILATLKQPFLDFLDYCRPLMRITFGDTGMQLAAQPRVFACLAGRASLTELLVASDRCIPASSVQFALCCNPSGAFVSLRRLTVETDAHAFRRLAVAAATGASLPSLVDLHLCICKRAITLHMFADDLAEAASVRTCWRDLNRRECCAMSRVLADIAACPAWQQRLQVLQIMYRASLELAASDVAALDRLIQLRVLSVWCGSCIGADGIANPFACDRRYVDRPLRQALLRVSNLRKADLVAMLAPLQSLRELCFEVYVPLDVRLVGELCPRLEKLSLGEWCHRLSLTTDGTAVRLPLSFPNLLVMRLHGLEWHNEGKLLVRVLLLYQHSGSLMLALSTTLTPTHCFTPVLRGKSCPFKTLSTCRSELQLFTIASLYLTIVFNFLIILTALILSCKLCLSMQEGMQILAK
jgi:hypothetical protein